MIGFRWLRISGELLLGFFMPGDHPAYEVIENGLPPDAKVVGTAYDPTTGWLNIKIASASFDGPAEGERADTLPPIICERRSHQ